MQALVEIRDPTVTSIFFEAAKDPNSSDAFWAATGLGYVHGDAALARLHLLLSKSTDPMIRDQAARSLIVLGDRSKVALQTVEQALHSQDVAEAAGAALALGDKRDPTMVPILKQVESEERVSSEVQLAAAVALTHYSSDEGLPLLNAALENPRLSDFLMAMFARLDFHAGTISPLTRHVVARSAGPPGRD